MRHRFLFLITVLVPTGVANAQWLNGGNPFVGGEYLGLNAAGQIPLKLRTTNNHPVEIWTSLGRRLRVNQGQPLLQTIGLFANVNTTAFTALVGEGSFWSNAPGAFSRFHLADRVGGLNYQNSGYRPWQRNGITFTGNNDQMYIGHKYSTSNLLDPVAADLVDYSDAVIQWSDNPGTWLGDRMRFIFTSQYNAAATTGNSCLEGLEAMQLFPVENGTEVFVGIGDWFGQAAQPSERLDLLDRTIRARRIVPDYHNDALDKLLVIDDNGRFHWRDVNSLTSGPGAPDCDWLVDLSTNVTTAWDATAPAGCPDETSNVGIGVANPNHKLSVHDLWPDNTSVVETAVDINIQGDQFTAYGLFANVNSTITNPENSFGIETRAYNGSVNTTGVAGYGRVAGGSGSATAELYGIRGEAILDGDARSVFGGRADVLTQSVTGSSTYEVYGTHSLVTLNSPSTFAYGTLGRVMSNHGSTVRFIGASGEALGNGYDPVNGYRIGVYGEAGVVAGNPSWAGYFNGNVAASGTFSAGVVLPTSDGMLKQNVAVITNGTSILAQLQPSTYTFDTAGYAMMNLPSGPQSGVVAQNVQDVLPHLVYQLYCPAQYDGQGNMTSAGFPYLAVNYDGIIPYLIAGFNEQQTRINAQDQQLADMQQQLAACCNDGTGGLFQGQGTNGTTGQEDALRSSSDQLTIAPNPFEHQTTITYRSDAQGRVALRVSDGRGQHIDTLRDQQQDAGTYNYVWNTEGLAPGMYTVTLLLDGTVLVERAVKVGQ